MSEPKKARQGWGWPLNSRKAHFFVGFTALCGKFLYTGTLDEDDQATPDDCAECRRKRDAMLAKASGAQS